MVVIMNYKRPFSGLKFRVLLLLYSAMDSVPRHWICFFLESPYAFSFSLSSTAPVSLSLQLHPRSAQVGFTPENFLGELFLSFFQLLLSSSPKRNVALANPPLLLRRSKPKCSFAAIRPQAQFPGGFKSQKLYGLRSPNFTTWRP